MSDIIITIQGLPELLNKLSDYPESVRDEVADEILDSVFKINSQQRRLAPADQGGLRRNIGFDQRVEGDNAFFNIFSNSEHSAYMEFGTRYRVRIPAGLEELAETFRGAGISSRLKAKEAIYAWCERVGIPKRGWYPVFLAIMTVGVMPHPFFIQPFLDEKPKLLSRIEAIINENKQL